MTRRILFTTSAMVLSFTLSSSTLMHAAGHATGNAAGNTAVRTAVLAAPSLRADHASTTPAKMKLIKFSIRNDSKTPLQLKAGDQQMTIAPGQTSAVKLPMGLQVTTVSDTAHLPSGAVLTTVSEALQGNTLAVS